ncbi:MAG: ferredoxin [Acidimicrobiales bacterium]
MSGYGCGHSFGQPVTDWEKNMKVVVDFDLCESNAVCMAIAPEVFEVRDDDFLYILNENPGPELHEKVREAAERCPKQAITLTD